MITVSYILITMNILESNNYICDKLWFKHLWHLEILRIPFRLSCMEVGWLGGYCVVVDLLCASDSHGVIPGDHLKPQPVFFVLLFVPRCRLSARALFVVFLVDALFFYELCFSAYCLIALITSSLFCSRCVQNLWEV